MEADVYLSRFDLGQVLPRKSDVLKSKGIKLESGRRHSFI